MTNQSGGSEPVVPAEVSDLIDESHTIQGWIERLAQHSDDVRSEVFERVLGDYQERLGRVSATLAKHRSDLVAGLEVRQVEVESLQDARDSHAAELEEASLRHAVGEYSDGTWDDRRGSIEESLNELDELLEIEESAVRELAGIIDSMERGGTSSTVEDRPDAIEVEEEPEIVVESDDADLDLATSEVEEVEEVQDVIDAAADESSSVVAASSDDDAEAEGDYMDELEFLESLSLDESDKFDAMSAMLDDEEGGKKDA